MATVEEGVGSDIVGGSMRRTEALLLLMLLLSLLAGCSSGGGTRTPGAEVTNVQSASEEPTATESAEQQNGNQAVAVELPGLPIGGSDVEFESASTQCADVSWTGGDIPQGVQVSITSLHVPAEFSLDGQPCGAGPPCLPRHVFTANSGGCTVGVTWSGATPADGQAALSAAAGTVVCPDQQTCADFISAVAAEGVQTIGLSITAASSE